MSETGQRLQLSTKQFTTLHWPDGGANTRQPWFICTRRKLTAAVNAQYQVPVLLSNTGLALLAEGPLDRTEALVNRVLAHERGSAALLVQAVKVLDGLAAQAYGALLKVLIGLAADAYGALNLQDTQQRKALPALPADAFTDLGDLLQLLADFHEHASQGHPSEKVSLGLSH